MIRKIISKILIAIAIGISLAVVIASPYGSRFLIVLIIIGICYVGFTGKWIPIIKDMGERKRIKMRRLASAGIGKCPDCGFTFYSKRAAKGKMVLCNRCGNTF